MALKFYPHEDEMRRGTTPEEKIEILMDGAEHYKAIILDAVSKGVASEKRSIPRDLPAAYNWGELAKILREIREITEVTREDKIRKAHLLIKLAEVYEVLRAAKMSKLEAVRLALISEANQLGGGQVA